MPYRGHMTGHRAAWGAAAAVVVTALGVAPAGAAAAGTGLTTASFDISVSGTQTTRWSVDRTAYDGCVDGDLQTVGSGTQHVTFRSSRRVRFEALKVDGDTIVNAGIGGIPVRGTVEQQGGMRVTQLSGGESFCGGTETPMAPPAPDCGRRSWRGTIQPIVLTPAEYPTAPAGRAPRTRVLGLTGPHLDGDQSFSGLYANCPGAEGLLIATPNSAFPAQRVFSRRTERLVIRGSEAQTDHEDGHSRTVTVRWRAVLVRRRPGRPQRAPECSNGRDDDHDGRVDFPRDRECRSPHDRSEG